MARIAFVQASYALAEAENDWKHSIGDDQATSMYVYPSQKQDAAAIVEAFRNVPVVSVTKRTKIGMDGLMIEVLYRMALSGYTEPRILTGMNNRQWMHDMKAKTPSCFRDHIYHHGKLHRAQLESLTNAVILVDEVDTGDKEMQVLHATLKAARLLDFDHLVRQNIKLMFASATMFKELYDLHKYPAYHRWICLTVPPNYVSHGDFLKMGIIREHYAMERAEDARRWLNDDVLTYGPDYRIHICRLKAWEGMEQACLEAGVEFRAYTSTDTLTHDGLRQLFTAPLTAHVVIAVKGFYRRATMIPNAWKLKIGATHELYTTNVDYNVQIQGLPGRMTGYWKDALLAGHVTGPHRCSTLAVENYEKLIQEPFGDTSYQAQGFHKGKLGVTATPTMLTGIAAAPSDTPFDEGLGAFRLCPLETPNIAEWCEQNKWPRFELINNLFQTTYADFVQKHFIYKGDVPLSVTRVPSIPEMVHGGTIRIQKGSARDHYAHLQHACDTKTATSVCTKQQPNTFLVIRYDGYDRIHVTRTTRQKTIPPVTTDYLRKIPYRICGDTVHYTILKSQPTTADYYFVTAEGWVYRHTSA